MGGATMGGWTVREFRPANFAFVMATGIVSVAAAGQGFERLGLLLFGITVSGYVFLVVLTSVRLLLYPEVFIAELREYDEGLSFLTAVAATCLVGSSSVGFFGVTRISAWLLVLGVILWLVLNYAVFIVLTVDARDRPLQDRIHGGWLLVTVATQSVAILGALLAPSLEALTAPVLFGALSMFLLGGALYLVLITLVVYRIVFLGLEPTTIGPPYWINAGAVAITTLAGATLLSRTSQWIFLADFEAFVRGLTLLFWTTATWWIPLLVALGVWRHIVGGIALPVTRGGYDVSYWSIVFPLGMYTVATRRFAVETQLPILGLIPPWFVFVALFAWVGTFLGLSHVILNWIGARLGPTSYED